MDDQGKSGNERKGSGGQEDREADLILTGGKVLNVYSGEVLESAVALRGEKILYVSPRLFSGSEGVPRIDLAGKVLVPGYVEPHCHPWNIYNPITFGEEACRLGTTTLVCDNLFFFLFMGVEGFESFMTGLSQMPVKYYWFVRTVPQTPMENEEALFSPSKVERLLRNPLSLSIGEITRWKELIHGHPNILRMIETAQEVRKRVDGHTAGAKLQNVNRISLAGVESCHESIEAGEALERLRLGFHVMLRESSLRQDLRGLLRLVRDHPSCTRRIMMTTDSSTPAFQHESGMTNHLIGIALEEGVDPVEAYRMTTLNPAAYFGLENRLGGIAPGRDADILVLSDLYHPTPETVISKGRVVAERGSLITPFPDMELKEFFSTPAARIERNWSAKPDFFEIPCGESCGRTIRFPVIRLVNPVITRVETLEFPVRDGCVEVSARDGFCWIATLNRHGRWVSNGIIQGYSDRLEGIATTFNTAVEILAVGRNPEAMAAAVNRVLDMGGGIAAVERGEAVFEWALPLGGMMSERPMSELAEEDRRLGRFLVERGYPFHDPLYSFIFLPNDFLPEVRINRRGVIDIRRNEVLWPGRSLP